MKQLEEITINEFCRRFEGQLVGEECIDCVKFLLSAQRQLLLDILEHNQDNMTGLYDYDGIAEDIIDLVKK